MLTMFASGAVSGFVVLLLMLAIGRWLSIEFDAWPNLSSLWLLWMCAYALIGGMWLIV